MRDAIVLGLVAFGYGQLLLFIIGVFGPASHNEAMLFNIFGGVIVFLAFLVLEKIILPIFERNKRRARQGQEDRPPER
jgi:hypothetical protein